VSEVDPHPHVTVVERYLECLRNDDFEGAADRFTTDARYFHSPTFRDEVFVSYAEVEDGRMSYYCAGFLKGTIG
jgi:hypothetical protein